MSIIINSLLIICANFCNCYFVFFMNNFFITFICYCKTTRLWLVHYIHLNVFPFSFIFFFFFFFFFVKLLFTNYSCNFFIDVHCAELSSIYLSLHLASLEHLLIVFGFLPIPPQFLSYEWIL